MMNTHYIYNKEKTLRLFLAGLMWCLTTVAMAQITGIEASEKEADDVIAGIDMKHWNFDLRAGYSIGGTVPFDMPAEMRKINSFSPKFNYRLGFDVEYRFNPTWGVMSGLYIERKGFTGDMSVKGYDIEMRQGGEKIKGPFTGNVKTTISQIGVTIPVQASWYINRKLKLRWGVYFSFLSDREFYGYAYGEPTGDGKTTAYLRQDGPQGPLVFIGNDEKSRGSFDGEEYKDFMRTFQAGGDVGVDWFFSRHWGAFFDLSCGFMSAFNDKEGNPVHMALYPLYGTLGVTYKIGR